MDDFALTISIHGNTYTEEFKNSHGTWFFTGEVNEEELRFMMIFSPKSHAIKVDKVFVKVLSQSKDRFIFEKYIKTHGYNFYQHMFKMDNYKPSDLTLIVHINVSTVPISSDNPRNSMTLSAPPNDSNSLLAYNKKMMSTQMDCDVKIVTKNGGEDIEVHHYILGRSPVLKEMVDEAEEAHDGFVEIGVDFDFDVMEELVRYLYTDEVRDVDEIGADLLNASITFDLPGLTEMLRNYLKNNVSFNNFIDVLEKGDELNLEDLKEAAIEFIVENHAKIIHEADWYDWMDESDENNRLGREVMDRCISSLSERLTRFEADETVEI